ncbi:MULTISPECIES: hypothetical protein [Streptomyces]|uniref:hypothetical protein n=1 Tax=Streptomyces TaxID=1883 RepID=UPI0021F8828A|nr:hypothetical protein [Streptomyces sp. RS2]MCW1095074.1 hypothetical protein [Streptomyces sp. RS2]
MSVTPIRRSLSNPDPQPWWITVIVVVVIFWRPFGEAVSAIADAVAVAGLLTVGCSTAVKYSRHSNRHRPVASS